MQVIVLGMHRSGTSSITRLLNLAGCYFGPEGIATEANEENPKGFWERRDVRAVCDGLLHDGGHDWWRVTGLDLESMAEDVVAPRLAEMRRIILDLDAHRPWVVKEPRLCLLAPLVQPLLEAPVFVHVSREPLEIARSLEARNGFPIPVGVALWEEYTVRALRASAGEPRVHVRYGDLVADPVPTTEALIGALGELGVDGLRVPSAREVEAFVERSLHRYHAEPERRPGQLNSTQQALARALDEGRLPEAAELEVSEGARQTLAAFEDARASVEAVTSERDELARELSIATETAARAARDHASALDQATRRGDELAASLRSAEEQLETTSGALAERTAAARTAAAQLDEANRRLRVARSSRLVRAAARLGRVRGRGGVDTALQRTQRQIDLARGSLEGGASPERRPASSSDDPPPSAHELSGRRAHARAGGAKPKVAVLAWDVGHNPFGRAHLLADLLGEPFDVEIWGTQFDRYGSSIWAPMRNTTIPVRRLPGADLPELLDRIDDAACRIDADAIVVSKPRFPSLALALRAVGHWSRPLIVDIDDHEPSFFGETSGLDVRSLLDHPDDPDLLIPYGRSWTLACESVVGHADAITVSNVVLQHRFGGTIVPHARDESLFDPGRFDRDERRDRLGLSQHDRLILFGGTARRHKGILDLLQAVDRLGDQTVRVGVFASKELDELRPELAGLDRWLLAIEPPTFQDLPGILVAADLSCALQAPDHVVSQYQLPAKVTDAMAMAVPCLVTAVPPLQPLIDKDLVAVHDPDEPLHHSLQAILDDPASAADRAARAREAFLAEASYGAVRPVLTHTVHELLDGPPRPHRERHLLLDTARAIFRPGSAPAPRRTRPFRPGAELDLVVFWKQNDTGIYGRRQDMLLEHLERSGRFRSIVHFDHPISVEGLARIARQSVGSNDQNRLVLRQTLRRLLHRSDRGAVRHRTFVYSGGRRSRGLGLPARDDFPAFVQRVLADAGIGTRPVVLWVYPTNAFFPAVADAVRPDVIVADVVDDNRTWYEPGSPQLEQLEQNYAEILRRSDVVLANCEPVAESMRQLAPTVHVVANACELPGRAPLAARPRELAGLQGPIIGYAGNLSDRVDLRLLREVARARPDWNLVLVGSTHLDRSALALAEEPNVRLCGTLPYAKAKQVISHFDVGLIPHVDNRMTRSMNPLKAYVYCSVGVPVVATPVENLGELGDLITVAEGADEFVAAIESALSSGRRPPDVEQLRPHSWPARVEQVLRIIDDTCAVPEEQHPAGGDRPCP